MKKIYLIGALKNPQVPVIAARLRAEGFEVFDDWWAPGPKTDDYWKEYEEARGHSYVEALRGWHAQHVFAFDKKHLAAADIAVLVQPAGRSAHLELGWMLGRGRKGYILLDTEPRWDVMMLFADGVFETVDALCTALKPQVRFADSLCFSCGKAFAKGEEDEHIQCRGAA
jgi:hypothetical protein